MQKFNSRRQRTLKNAIKQAKVDGMLITRSEDLNYLSGFTGDSSFLLFSKAHTVLLTDGRFAEWARKECPDIEVNLYKGKVTDAIAKYVKKLHIRRLGIQAEHVTLQFHKALSEVVGEKRLRTVANAAELLRRRKDADEVKAIQKSIRVAQKAFKQLLGKGAVHLVGKTERQVAAELDYLMHIGGASKMAFETMVAAGPSSSKPHYCSGSRRIKRNEIVMFDWGANVGGYCSDLTRVVAIGKILPKLAEIHEVVLKAQKAAIATARPGVMGKTVDSAARRVISNAGFAENFLHGTGHGIGRVVHEAPGLGYLSKNRLSVGAVVTVEPGIYLPGLGGIRIEDDILITDCGARLLSTLPRALSAMTLK